MSLKTFKNPLYLTLAATALLIIASLFIPFLHPFAHSFFMFWKTIWWAVLLGLIIAGLIDAFIPKQYIAVLLAGQKKRTIFYAAILGFFMSVCSHGVLAISMELYKKGASAASVITFLLASPWANVAITLMLFAFFGPKAFLFIVAALIIALITGFIYQFLEKKQLIEQNPHAVKVSPNFSIKKDIKKRLQNTKLTKKGFRKAVKKSAEGIKNAAHMVLWWIIIGTLVASALDAFIPREIFENYLGPHILGLLITLAFATIIEVCSEGSAPIAFSIYKQTQAFGNAYIFLMAGVITDITEIGLIWANIGKRAAVFLPLVTIPQTLIIAYLFNLLFS